MTAPSTCHWRWRGAFDEKSVKKVGISPDNPWTTEYHYLYFRNAIHFSRASTSSLLSISPLLQKKLVSLSYSDSNEYKCPKEYSPSIITDLLVLLNPNLSQIEFDEPMKNLNVEYIKNRSEYLGTIQSYDEYSIIGSPKNIHSGTPDIFIKLAKNNNFIGHIDLDTIKKYSDIAYNKIPTNLKKYYKLHKYIIDYELSNNNITSWAGFASGKLLQFLLVD